MNADTAGDAAAGDERSQRLGRSALAAGEALAAHDRTAREMARGLALSAGVALEAHDRRLREMAQGFALGAGAAIEAHDRRVREVAREFALGTGEVLANYDRIAREAAQAASAMLDTYSQVARGVALKTGALVEMYNRFARNSMPDLVQAFTSASEYENLFRAAGMLILADAVPAESGQVEQWRAAANAWLSTNAKALFWWLMAALLTLLFVYAAATGGYEMIDKTSTVLSTPLGVIGLGLALWASSKEK